MRNIETIALELADWTGEDVETFRGWTMERLLDNLIERFDSSPDVLSTENLAEIY